MLPPYIYCEVYGCDRDASYGKVAPKAPLAQGLVRVMYTFCLLFEWMEGFSYFESIGMGSFDLSQPGRIFILLIVEGSDHEWRSNMCEVVMFRNKATDSNCFCMSRFHTLTPTDAPVQAVSHQRGPYCVKIFKRENFVIILI